MDTIPDISIDHWSMLQNREGIFTFSFVCVTKKYGEKTNKQTKKTLLVMQDSSLILGQLWIIIPIISKYYAGKFTGILLNK